MDKIGDLSKGRYDLTLALRGKKETERKRGWVVESRDGKKHFLTRNSPKQSFGPGTIVADHKKEEKIIGYLV